MAGGTTSGCLDVLRVTRGLRRAVLACVVGGLVVLPTATAAHRDGPLSNVCASVQARGLDRQTNLHASAVLVACGLTPGGAADTSGGASPAFGGGANVDVITGTEVYPHVTQSEDQVWVHGSTVVVNYNDSATAPTNYSGTSVSTDGGATFTRLLPAPFALGHGTNFGDPIVVYNEKLAKWFAGDLVTGCGGQGMGLWTSTDGSSWVTGACLHSGTDDDRESMYVDNNPASPHYGRMYVSWNDFSPARNGALLATYSDNGTAWSAPATLNAGFIRNTQLTVGPDGTVFVPAMNEFGGGFNPRSNVMYRSTDGGVSWSSQISMGASFAAPGDTVQGYFAGFKPIWRAMGWGEAAVCPGGKLVSVYYQHGAGGDAGDIYVVRSANNGLAWGAPARIDGSSNVSSQWMPSIAASGQTVFVAWYDRRNSTDTVNYERWGRTSQDCGVTWSAPQPVSDVLIPQPAQPDPNVQSFYAGDYMRDVILGEYAYDAWTDGRKKVANVNQQDVESRKMDVVPPGNQVVTVTPNKKAQTSTTFTVGWSATDGGSGVANYDISYKSSLPSQPNYGPYGLWQSATTSTSAPFTGTTGGTYCFVEQARDNAGNLAARSKSKCTGLPADDPSLSVVSGTWTPGSGAAYYEGTNTSSPTVGGKLTTGNVYAHRIGVLADKCPTCGSIQIFWMGGLVGTFSLTNATTKHKQFIGMTVLVGTQFGPLDIVVASGTPVIDGVVLVKN